ncbi:MAG TPA: hypothetical protein DCD98_05480 [Syntrophomonas sp.]|jgi:hypothetical protein|nr:hypothetical protein [Syntrophomonas sp.]
MYYHVGRGLVMSKRDREQVIRRIIDMEDRISNCQRCGTVIRCIRKPSLGKGDLEPELLMVLESDNQYSRDINRMIELRNLIKTGLGFEKIYHTYLVRCQPKACPLYNSINCYTHRKLLDKEYRCVLSQKACEGIPIHPNNESIIACLSFLMEEISILNPKYLVLFGERVAEYVLRAYGFFEKPDLNHCYRFNGLTVIPSVDEGSFSLLECQQIKRNL